ncbi:hypothetical protein Tco_0585766 [Tanacetum coccineum]
MKIHNMQQFTPTKVTQGEEQCQESSKAQLGVLSAAKILADASKERAKTYTRRRKQPSEEPKELSEEELKKMMEIVLVEEIKAEALQVKYPIIDWETHTKGSRKYWKIIRSLVKERFRSAKPTKDKERALWVELKRLFKLDKDDVLGKSTKDISMNPLTMDTVWYMGSTSLYHQQRHESNVIKGYPIGTCIMI